jgi:6-phosphofructokinase 1
MQEIYRGYQGMIEGDFKEMGVANNIVKRKGTVLKSARSLNLKPRRRKKAYEHLSESSDRCFMG